ncbi:MAG: hypothetical protein U0232_33990, partial [Thermomicrobiales bacterium]
MSVVGRSRACSPALLVDRSVARVQLFRGERARARDLALDHVLRHVEPLLPRSALHVFAAIED